MQAGFVTFWLYHTQYDLTWLGFIGGLLPACGQSREQGENNKQKHEFGGDSFLSKPFAMDFKKRCFQWAFDDDPVQQTPFPLSLA